ncbi:MAG: ATP-dependent sacrificial sulfur transferase LarE [Lawsonibacter sp.]|nr:ATP-dependent sacrificial sulfur transferase LarE [Lawsonibacter sp.]
MTLEQFFKEHPRAALAFSGGVDSAYLLWAGLQAGAEVWPYFVKTPFQPRFELEDAYRLCEQLEADLIVLDYDILDHETVVSNPPDRCYHCKRWMFSKLKRYAASEGFSLLLDGTNASDDGGDRPGMRALEELEVRSPLRECGLTKEMIRERSRQAGLFTWDKPSYACLATRIPTGQAITRSDLERVERGEGLLSGMGFRDFRLRLTAGGAKLQVLEAQLPLVLERRAGILSALKADFPQITLDLRPRVPID